ncbi:zinc finger Ran-binding domain-containing protein 2 [Ricinus communis]|uniref:zinc finger Ran-binding domain-containing protein 2 n=1 Tax=Ricinus communis TaxID=3988 RepID=UPI0007726192|nr:zinc finger Ran-binding domain-containing protein 2 [Ricinus communis]|eukprot:XP_015578032.1 zinc finger Ran-binding domain-containing protein 2 [Ricinus communis]
MSWSGGDWICSACQHQNFRKREACQRCGYPKFHGPDPAGWTRVLPGDWYCTAMNCGAHNYASRPSCYRCGTSRNEYGSSCGSESTFPPGWKSGDWICPRMGCGEHNYASRNECFRCKARRDFGDAVQ